MEFIIVTIQHKVPKSSLRSITSPKVIILFNKKTEEAASTDVRQMPHKMEVFLVCRSRLQNDAFIAFFIQIPSLSGAMATVSNESTSFTI